MSFQIDLDPFELAYAQFVAHVRDAIQRTYAEGVPEGLTQREIAETLDIDPGLVSKRLNGPGNLTLRTLSDLYTAMGREPLSNFVCPERPYSMTPPRTGTSEGRQSSPGGMQHEVRYATA